MTDAVKIVNKISKILGLVCALEGVQHKSLRAFNLAMAAKAAEYNDNPSTPSWMSDAAEGWGWEPPVKRYERGNLSYTTRGHRMTFKVYENALTEIRVWAGGDNPHVVLSVDLNSINGMTFLKISSKEEILERPDRLKLIFEIDKHVFDGRVRQELLKCFGEVELNQIEQDSKKFKNSVVVVDEDEGLDDVGFIGEDGLIHHFNN